MVQCIMTILCVCFHFSLYISKITQCKRRIIRHCKVNYSNESIDFTMLSQIKIHFVVCLRYPVIRAKTLCSSLVHLIQKFKLHAPPRDITFFCQCVCSFIHPLPKMVDFNELEVQSS